MCARKLARGGGYGDISLEIIFGDLPVKMTSTNEFVPVMKQNVPVIIPDCHAKTYDTKYATFWLKSLNT